MSAADDEEIGIIGEVVEDGFPVIYAFLNELPSEERMSALPHLTVVSWIYDGTQRNGMPDQETNEAMITLEATLSAEFENTVESQHAYNRTGNGLKEFAYYVADPGAFITALNRVLKRHPRYPIKITFYEDHDWSDFKQLLELFREEAE